MSNRQKVIWNEGMCLEPHHFQQWDRHVRYLQDVSLRGHSPYNWGVSDIAIDKEALANGTFTLLRCRGILPDGLIFSIPDEDLAPPSESVKEHFRPTDNMLPAYLTIPVERENGRNCRLEGDTDARETRYLSRTISVADENSGTDERTIEVARPDFRMRFGTGSMEDLTVLKAAEIVRAPDGSFLLSDKFIPPCLTLEASETLMNITRRMVELLVARASALSAALGGSWNSSLMPQDFRFLLALQTLNGYIPVLNHFYTIPKVHPEIFYRKLLELAGELSTFSPEGETKPRSLPRYVHDHFAECFPPLDLQIRILLDGLAPSAKYFQIPLDKKGESLYVSRTIDPNILQKGNLYLLVSGEMQERRIIDEVPTNFRVASPDTMSMVLSSFRKALAIKYVASPAGGLPHREGAYYFQLDPAGPFWEAVCKSGALAIFIPKEMSHLAIEVLAL